MSDRKSITINSDSLFGGGSKKSATRRTKGSSSGTNRRLRPSSIVQPSTLKKTLLERIKQHQKLREQGRDRDRESDKDNTPDQVQVHSRSALDHSSSSKEAPDAESSFTQSMDFLRKLALKKRQNATQRRSSESMITEPAKTPEAKMLNQVADTLHNGEIITNTGLIGLPIINTDISSIMKPAMVTPMATMGVAPMATMPTMAMAPEISNLPFGMVPNTLPTPTPTPTLPTPPPNITQLADLYNSTIASSADNSNTNSTAKDTDDLPIHVPDDPESFLPSIFIKEAPPHGCLKNGTKPTFREWANKLINKPVETIKNMFGGGDEGGATASASSEVTGGVVGGSARKTVSKPIDNPENIAGMRVKIRRTQKKKYRIGKHDDVVGVLLKNKESQRHIQKQHLALKQKTIGEIRKHLYEHHLLKIGSNAPPDVLRRMYEDSILTGEVKNTNKGVLLHNFLSGES